MPTITIDKNVFKAGFASSNEENNGGLSPISKGANYYKGDGALLYPMPARTEINNVLQDQVIAGDYDNSGIGVDALFVDKSGYYYSFNGTTLTQKQHDTSGNEYAEGTTNLIYFKSNVYCTSKTDIIKLSSSLSTIDTSWWVTTKGNSAFNSNYRHIMVVVEDVLYIANSNNLNIFDGTNTQENWMSLPTGVNITAMCKHPNGRHLIVFASTSINYSHSQQATGIVYIIDTVTAEFIQEIVIEEQVEGCWVQGGTIYVTYGTTFGYFDGSGLTPIRLLERTTSAPKAFYTAIGKVFRDGIIIPEEDSVFAFGNNYDKNKIAFYPVRQSSATSLIKFTMPIARNKICVVYKVSTTWYFATIDFDSTTALTDIPLRFIKYNFSGKVWVRRVDAYFKEVVASGDITYIYGYSSQQAGAIEIGSLDHSVDGAIKRKERMMCNIFTDFIQIAVVMGKSANYQGLEKLVIHYESGE